jgi:hypothetical protein
VPGSEIDIDTPLELSQRSLSSLAAAYRDAYQRAAPFPHVVLEDFFPAAVLEEVLTEFPAPSAEGWLRYENARERKLETTQERALGTVTQRVLQELNSPVFLQFLEVLTGIEGLVPDPYFWGGGLHQIEPGGLLKIHADFNWHPQLLLRRRLNLLLYLNRDWRDDYGGHLEMWDRTMHQCVRRIIPIFNRCVIFNTTDVAFHGHPQPLTCPEGMTRKSIALYYYSNGQPTQQAWQRQGTRWRPRPGESWRPELRAVARQLVPPILVDVARNMRRRRDARAFLHAGSQPEPSATDGVGKPPA